MNLGRPLIRDVLREKIRLKAMFPFYTRFMRNEFTAVIERDNDWFVAWSPEIPGANGQGGAWKSAVRARPLRFN